MTIDNTVQMATTTHSHSLTHTIRFDVNTVPLPTNMKRSVLSTYNDNNSKLARAFSFFCYCMENFRARNGYTTIWSVAVQYKFFFQSGLWASAAQTDTRFGPF
jgi:hypothetical protein